MYDARKRQRLRSVDGHRAWVPGSLGRFGLARLLEIPEKLGALWGRGFHPLSGALAALCGRLTLLRLDLFAELLWCLRRHVMRLARG